jgi:pyridoxal phosphate enzyme (YggS family)
MSVADRLSGLRGELPAGVRLVAVSKFHPVSAVCEAYAAGQRLFGESRVQELAAKREGLPEDVEWHFIGHLQVNKVKVIAPFIAMVQSVDSLRLLDELNRRAGRCDRRIGVLLQIHIAREEQKTGFSYAEAESLISSGLPAQFPHLRFCGLMGMATFTDDLRIVRQEFAALAAFFRQAKMHLGGDFRELSMGMSDDFRVAIEEGSTMVRVGTGVFGGRIVN